MSETFWESGAAVEPQPQVEAREPQAEPGSLAVSAVEFSALEERILRAVELVKREREHRASAETRATQAETRATQAESRVALAEALASHAEERAAQAEERATQAETRATQAEAQLNEQAPASERMQSELSALKAERDHVRQRVERLLQQMEGLEL